MRWFRLGLLFLTTVVAFNIRLDAGAFTINANTGQSVGGTPLADNGIDASYRVGSGSDVATALSATPGNAYAWVNSGFPIGPWATFSDARWISHLPSNSTNRAGNNLNTAADGYYAYTTRFTLTDPTSVTMAGKYLADNYLNKVLLNGHEIFSSNPTGTSPGDSNYSVTKTFNFNSNYASYFKAGTNLLQFVTVNYKQNGGNPQGFAAQLKIKGEFGMGSISPVPEPGTLCVLALGIPAIGLIRRRMAK